MKHALTCTLCLFLFKPAFCQVYGTITDTTNQPVAFATVALLNMHDNTLIKSGLSENNGSFKLNDIPAGNYFLKVSMMTFQTWLSPVFAIATVNGNKNFGTIRLKDVSRQLSEVVIRSNRPLVEQQAGGLVVNVQSSLLAKGSSALEVLQRSPGVQVNPNDNTIRLNGKTGVMVMLDGKLMRLSAAQVAALLNGMSADDIDKIELLSTPPAKYDADGSAGLINIVTKKNKRKGTNDSFTATAGYGKGEKTSGNVILDHNSGTVNLHGSYSYTHDRGYAKLFANGSENVPSIGGQTSFDYYSQGKPLSNYYTAGLGADVQLNPTTIVGGDFNYNLGFNKPASNNKGLYTLRPDSDLFFNADLTGHYRSTNATTSIYIEKKFNAAEQLRLDADYIAYKSDGTTEVASSFVDNHGTQAGAADSLYANSQRDLANTTITVGVLKADYSNQLSKATKLEIGFKGTYTNSAASSGIEKMVDEQWVLSGVGTSSNLATTEGIAAGYATFNTQIDSLNSLVIGARYEYSHNGTDKSVNPSYAIDRKLGKFFPYVFYAKTLSDQSELQLSFSSRISRPSYNDLASYVVYNDPVSVFTGNPALKPTVTYNLKLGYNRHNYLFSLLFSRDENPILYSQINTGPTKGIVYISPVNARWQNTINLQANIPVKVNDWWDMSYNILAGPRQYRVDYTPQPFEKIYVNYSINFNENFKVANDLSIELSGYYYSASYYGNSAIKGFGVVNTGIKKQLKNNGGSFQLTVSDLLRSVSYKSQIGRLTTDAFNTNAYVDYQTESGFIPVIKVSYFRNFGSSSVKSKKAEDASKEERGRIGN